MPLSPTATRALLAQLGHKPRQFLGQNFLIDGNIVRKSIELAGVRPGDGVVEVGPGLGTLTAALLEAGAEVWAVEKDPVLFAHLASALAPNYPASLHLLAGDAVEHPLAGFEGPSFKIVSNLPYAIATPWLDAVLSGPLPDRMVLMLQREAAERYTARPGTKSFGAISVFLQSAYDIEPGHKVSAACFFPKPDIESCFVNFARKPRAFIFPPAAKALIRTFFRQRRKQIGSLVKGRLPLDGAVWLEELAAAGLSPKTRPEAIPLALWVRIVFAAV